VPFVLFLGRRGRKRGKGEREERRRGERRVICS
jgi:hypothetical protein